MRPGTIVLSRGKIIDAALAFVDREGWDRLTINGLAAELGARGPSLYNHVNGFEDVRRAVRMRALRDVVDIIGDCSADRSCVEFLTAIAQRCREYARRHTGRYVALADMRLNVRDPEFSESARSTTAPIMTALTSVGIGREEAMTVVVQFWAALHGFILLEMTGAMRGVDTDSVFADIVHRLLVAVLPPRTVTFRREGRTGISAPR